jgi:hypothetical protein
MSTVEVKIEKEQFSIPSKFYYLLAGLHSVVNSFSLDLKMNGTSYSFVSLAPAEDEDESDISEEPMSEDGEEEDELPGVSLCIAKKVDGKTFEESYAFDYETFWKQYLENSLKDTSRDRRKLKRFKFVFLDYNVVLRKRRSHGEELLEVYPETKAKGETPLISTNLLNCQGSILSETLHEVLSIFNLKVSC